MKAFLIVLLSSLSFAAPKNIKCEGNLDQYMKKQQYTPGGITQISLQGALITDWIKNAVAQVTFVDYMDRTIVLTGRAAEFSPDRNYKPIKYKNYTRFDLYNLTEVQNFGRFAPGDQCQIQVLIPNDAMTKDFFQAPTQVHCDQSGGVTTLSCVTVK